jgi:hypothetical protein
LLLHQGDTSASYSPRKDATCFLSVNVLADATIQLF